MVDGIESKIKKEWITKALGNTNFSTTERPIDESLLEEEAVILLQGNNMFGDRVYSFVKFTLRNFRALRDAMAEGKDFKPSDYGVVLAAGRGEPTQELRDEMRVTYKMVDVPKNEGTEGGEAPNDPVGLSTPKYFDDND